MEAQRGSFAMNASPNYPTQRTRRLGLGAMVEPSCAGSLTGIVRRKALPEDERFTQ